MDPSQIKQLEELLKVPFVDSYGMTETGGGVFSTLPGLSGPEASIGVPISPGLKVKARNSQQLSISFISNIKITK